MMSFPLAAIVLASSLAGNGQQAVNAATASQVATDSQSTQAAIERAARQRADVEKRLEFARLTSDLLNAQRQIRLAILKAAILRIGPQMK
jgi:hypothetical protein